MEDDGVGKFPVSRILFIIKVKFLFNLFCFRPQHGAIMAYCTAWLPLLGMSSGDVIKIFLGLPEQHGKWDIFKYTCSLYGKCFRRRRGKYI